MEKSILAAAATLTLLIATGAAVGVLTSADESVRNPAAPTQLPAPSAMPSSPAPTRPVQVVEHPTPQTGAPTVLPAPLQPAMPGPTIVPGAPAP